MRTASKLANNTKMERLQHEKRVIARMFRIWRNVKNNVQQVEQERKWLPSSSIDLAMRNLTFGAWYDFELFQMNIRVGKYVGTNE